MSKTYISFHFSLGNCASPKRNGIKKKKPSGSCHFMSRARGSGDDQRSHPSWQCVGAGRGADEPRGAAAHRLPNCRHPLPGRALQFAAAGGAGEEGRVLWSPALQHGLQPGFLPIQIIYDFCLFRPTWVTMSWASPWRCCRHSPCWTRCLIPKTFRQWLSNWATPPWASATWTKKTSTGTLAGCFVVAGGFIFYFYNLFRAYDKTEEARFILLLQEPDS